MVNKTSQEERKAAARARRLIAAENRAKAVEFRRMGMSYKEIGNQLDISAVAAMKAVKRAVGTMEQLTTEEAAQLRAEEMERLDRMQLAAWPHAIKGSHLHIDRVLKVMERRAKMLGIDAPQKVAPTDPTGDKPYQPARDMTEAEREARIAELLARESEDDGRRP